MNHKYSVYVHETPDNKFYVGLTGLTPETRFLKGEGYKSNKRFYEEIKKFGWENIKHTVIASGLNEEEAKELEKKLIAKYNSNLPERGFNKTKGGEIVKIPKKEKTEYQIGENIKIFRERFGYSQNQLAKMVGISQALVWYYENDAKIPNILIADKLAKVFNITIDELLYGEKRA